MQDGGPGFAYWADFLHLQSEGPVEWRNEIFKGGCLSGYTYALLSMYGHCVDNGNMIWANRTFTDTTYFHELCRDTAIFKSCVLCG